MKKVAFSLCFAFIALLFSACESETKQAKVVEKSPNKQERIEPLVLKTTENKEIALNLDNGILVSSQLNGKIVLVNFFATWCPPCIKEIPTFNKLYKQYKGEFEIIAILYNDPVSQEDLNTFIKEHNIEFPVMVGENNAIAGQMFGNIKKIPESFVFSEDGFMLQKFVGIVDEKRLEEYITHKAE